MTPPRQSTTSKTGHRIQLRLVSVPSRRLQAALKPGVGGHKDSFVRAANRRIVRIRGNGGPVQWPSIPAVLTHTPVFVLLLFIPF